MLVSNDEIGPQAGGVADGVVGSSDPHGLKSVADGESAEADRFLPELEGLPIPVSLITVSGTIDLAFVGLPPGDTGARGTNPSAVVSPHATADCLHLVRWATMAPVSYPPQEPAMNTSPCCCWSPRCRWLLIAAAGVLAVGVPARGQSAPDPARVEAVTAMLSPQAQGVGQPITDRAAWQAIAKLPGLKGSVARAEKLLKEPIPELTEELYLDFSRTGNRTRCQDVIFSPPRPRADAGGGRRL